MKKLALTQKTIILFTLSYLLQCNDLKTGKNCKIIMRRRQNHQGIDIHEVSGEKLARIIKEHHLHQVFVSARSGSLKGYSPALRVGRLDYWDGTIMSPNETHFDFGFVSREGTDIIRLPYVHVRGLLLPIKLGERIVSAESYVLRN
jgi:hypothetical protein